MSPYIQKSDCPRCKAKHGWYEKKVIRGEQFFHANGEPSHFAEGLTTGGVRKYCYECDRNISNLIVLDTP